MPSKLQVYMQMADEAQRQIAGSYQGWTGFLSTAARLYKYPYAEQVMIHAQRPDATACAEYDFWNEKMGRYVCRGSKGIALIDSSGEKPRLRYVFDVADTGRTEQARTPYLWEYREEHADAVSSMLESRYDVSGENGPPNQLEHIAAQLANEYWNDYQRDILDIVDDSFLNGYDDFNVGVAFRNAATVSITYSLMSRCGLEPENRFDHEDFLPIFDFNTPAAAAELGTAVSRISGQVLRQIEVTIKNYEREKNAERSQNHVSGGSGMEGGKLRIYEFFSAKHTPKELADFLKEEYGTGGHSHAVSGATHSGEDHSAKGLSLKKENCAEIQLKWGDVAKRITDLIRKDRYLTPLEQEKYRAIHDAPTAYNSVKEQHPDDIVLYQVGDFFEMYGEDAKIAAEELDLYLSFRRIPDVGRVDMCGIPARRLEEYVEKLRDKHDVAISAVNEDTHERHVYTMLSVDHEAERATNEYEAEHGADGYLAFPGNRPEEEPKRELTQDNIDESLLRWNGDPDSQNRMFSYMREHGRERGAAAWLSQEYGGDVNEPLHFSLAGSDTEVTLKWAHVQRRLLQLMNDGRFPEQQKNIAEYLGERGNTLYFYAPVSYGIETDFGDVPKLRDDQRVVIASPVCYHGDEFLQEHRVTFLKIGRDIEDAQLKGQNPTEQISAMEQAENAFYTPEDRAYHVGDHVSIGNETDEKSEIVIENVDADYVYYTFPDLPEQEPVEILRSQFDAHLDDGLFAVIQPEEPAADLSPERMEQLVEAFETAGYIYDDINSYGGYLVFHGEGGDGCVFQSWEEADEWINGVIFDEQERNDAVEHVLHPERYENKESAAETPVQESEPPFPYEVGDTVYLEDGKPFLIENIGMFDIQLRDPSLAYPILRAESRESFARLMERFPQEQRTPEAPTPGYTIETVAEYPAEENHLPYDVVIQTIKTTEPDPPAQNFKITDEHLGEGGPKRMYYINYSNALATTQNQTTLDLVGNGMTPMQNLKYQFEFHNSTDYEIGDASITIPRSLYIDRNGNPVNPTDIGVPAAPAVSKASSFNYHVETVDGVEYLVFTNCKKIIAGSNNLIQIFYKLDDMMTVDETSWDIRAQLCIGGQDVSGDIVLHGSMDTETLPTTTQSIFRGWTFPVLSFWSRLRPSTSGA